MTDKQFPELEVLYEDNHLIAVNKPAGMLVQGDKTGDMPLTEYVKNYIREKYNKPGNIFLGLPHRIDRPVSGVLLLAKTSKALSRLNKAFREKKIQKTYWAIVKNPPPKQCDTLRHFLIKNQQKNKSRAYTKETKNVKEAILKYELLKNFDQYYLLKINPQTGRHHQIRVQLATINCPIKGDLKYGFPRTNPDASIHLHARQIDFIHPVKKESITIIAPVPQHDNLWLFFESSI